MLLAVEVRRMQELGDLEDRLRIDQDRAENALLGLDRLRCQLVDAHRFTCRHVLARHEGGEQRLLEPYRRRGLPVAAPRPRSGRFPTLSVSWLGTRRG